MKPIAIIAQQWLSNNGIEPGVTAVEFASVIVKQEPTWTVPDVICFFDFISTNQYDERLKVYGDKITPLRLLEMVRVYEEKKAEEREELWNEEKGKYSSQSKRTFSDQSIKSQMGKALEAVYVKNDDKKVYSAPADENYFKQYRDEKDKGTFNQNQK